MADGGLIEGIKVDIVRLHETWMGRGFPRQGTAVQQVLGKWQPRTRGDKLKYRLWAAIGFPLVGLVYPFLLVGFAARFNARRFNTATARLGIFGVVIVAAILWGGLTALARVRLEFGGFLAVGTASAVAVASAGIAALFTRIGGRGTTVTLGYPFAMNAVFLPPVVAALYDPSLSGVLEQSETLAIFLLDNVLYVYDANEYLRSNFRLEGMGVVLMWVGIATPFGWILGILVTLAYLIRPRAKSGDSAASAADDGRPNAADALVQSAPRSSGTASVLRAPTRVIVIGSSGATIPSRRPSTRSSTGVSSRSTERVTESIGKIHRSAAVANGAIGTTETTPVPDATRGPPAYRL